MKVKLEIDPDLAETVITIHAKEMSSEIEQIYRQIQKSSKHPDQIEGEKDEASYYLNLNDILFFETEEKQVVAHTAKDAFTVEYKLYELENLLSGQFMRVSKSTLLNVGQIYSLSRSISNCKVQFHDSYKTVYVSRHYYHDLCDRLDERRLS
ncbi:LytTR family DNA-binding domain-containing protein [Lactobacillus sp. ESL0791]|uniref:LytTR family DNA-binding domain-containing protein n=1 Tax=Lactobacillus sp. ESL0791 TaxID=2983234 RepID=UPI0023F65589|nr:LytTR family DNA-binding domain-containing protein [Lactobacillus sp. ESL0791]MDF7638001.1 LytTR family DNA-binding domain-containing protein [Lactobacillus sp. ESL0791]